MGKNISILLVVVVLALGGWWFYSNGQNNVSMTNESGDSMEENKENSNENNDSMMEDEKEEVNSRISEAGITSGGITLTDGNNELTHVMPNQIVDLTGSTDEVKEVTMTSYASVIDEGPGPRFSTKEITVKKGDKVKINVTVTSGTHNFNIDEYDIHEETPLNEQVTIEFTADKAGKFIYYCSKPGHRMFGHWGVLNVVE